MVADDRITDRFRPIILLLRSRNDGVPGPKTWTGSIARQAGAGKPVATEWVDCPTCQGTGYLRKTQMCSRCEGRTLIQVDAYTGEEVASEESGKPRCLTPRERDQEIARLEGLNEGPPDTLTATLSALARREAQGHYRELDRALESLLQARPHDRILLHLVYEVEERAVSELSDQALIRLIRSLLFLERRMPKSIRVPKEVYAWDERRKNGRETIVSLRRQGKSVRHISRVLNVDLRTVKRHLKAA